MTHYPTIGARALRASLAVTIFLLSACAMAQQNFDHFSTGFDLDGAHTTLTCENCHVGAVFTATNPNCVNCHSVAGTVRASYVPPDHVQSTAICSDCHTTASWAPVYYICLLYTSDAADE